MANATIMVTNPAHFEVGYAINPWMKPEGWRRDAAANEYAARLSWTALSAALIEADATLSVLEATPGLPDLVFTANSAVVLDRRVLLGRFLHAERRVEEPVFSAEFQRLREAGLVDEIEQVPSGIFQEGAGDCLWDPFRQLLWAGFGPRSSRAATAVIAEFFGIETVALELVSAKYYHLDACFMPLAGGEVILFPEAFSSDALQTIRDRVAPELLIEATVADAETFALNAVNIGRNIVTGKGARALRARLEERGYAYREVDLGPFLMSGGGAFCMTLRLDHSSKVHSSMKNDAGVDVDSACARDVRGRA